MKKCLLVLLALTFMFASACSNTGEKDNNAQNQGQTPPTNKQGEPAKTAEVTPDPFYKYPETVTLTLAKQLMPEDKTLPAGDTYDNNQYTRYILEKNNIKFDYKIVALPGDPFEQKKQVAIATNDFPDVMVVPEKDMRSMAAAGQLEDMTEVYEKWASKTIKDAHATTNGKALAKATFDGKLMAIPNIVPQGDAPRLLWVRQDWLDKLGLEQPKTIDDIEKVARAFVEQDPNGNGKADTVGLVGPISGADIMQDQGFASILSMYGAYPGYWIKDKDGQIVYGSIQPEAKEGLAKLRDWYAAGLIDKEFALRTEESELTAAGRAGMFYGPWWMPYGVQIGNSMQNDPKANWVALAAPVDAAGNFNTHTVPVSDSFVVVKKGIKNPEAVMLAINTTIEADRGLADDASKLNPSVGAGWWPMRFVIQPADATTRSHLMLKDVVDGKAGVDTLTNEMKMIYEAAKKANFDPAKDLGAWQGYWSYYKGAAPLAQSNLKPMYDLRTGYTKTMEDKWTTLYKLEQETYLKIIMGKEPLDSFDTYVENWKKLGGDQITEEVRALQ